MTLARVRGRSPSGARRGSRGGDDADVLTAEPTAAYVGGAVAVGRDLAADLIGIPAATLDARNQCHIPRSCTNVAVKYFVAGTLGAGGPLIPFVKLVAHVAHGAAIVYSDTADRTAFAIVGWKDGLAFGIVITGFGGACGQ